jgi:hypothetical protein
MAAPGKEGITGMAFLLLLLFVAEGMLPSLENPVAGSCTDPDESCP